MRLSKFAIGLLALKAFAAGLDDLAFLAGTWQGKGSGTPGDASAGGFSFVRELQSKVLVRRNFAEYPASKERPAFRHDDLMVVYEEAGKLRADYWDNEGHVIRYEVAVTAGPKATFVSAPVPGQPRFRFTYTAAGPGGLDLQFDIAPPGKPEDFKPYITAQAQRAK